MLNPPVGRAALRGWTADPTWALFVLALTSAAIAISAESAAAGLLLPGCILAVLAAYWFSSRPVAAMVAMAAAAAMPRLFVEVANTKVRPEHMIAVIACMALPFWYFRTEEKYEWRAEDRLLIVYMVLNLFSSAFMSIAPAQTLKGALQQIAGILPFFFVKLFADEQGKFRRVFEALLLIAVLEAAVGIFCFYGFELFGSSLGVELDQYGPFPATYGLQFEANILASYCAAGSAMLLAMYFSERKRKFLWGYAVAFAGMLVALSRAALLASVISYAAVLLYGLLKRQLTTKVIFKFAAATLIATLLLAPYVVPAYADRFGVFDTSDLAADGNAMTRVVQLADALEDIAQHPIAGNGSLSFALIFNWRDYGTDWEALGWIGNTEVRVLHDTGAIGLGVFVAFLFCVVLGAWKVLRRGDHPELVALMAGALVYLFTFQFTEGTLLAFPWVHTGLIASVVAIWGRSNKGVADATGNV